MPALVAAKRTVNVEQSFHAARALIFTEERFTERHGFSARAIAMSFSFFVVTDE
jgi:hypothetical protein